VELPHPMQLVVVGREPVRVPGWRPTRAAVWADGQRPELVEGEHPVRGGGHDMFDPGQFGFLGRVVGLLPRLGPLEGEVVSAQQLAESFPTDLDAVGAVVVGEVVDEFPDPPAGERLTEGFGSGVSRPDDERFVVFTDQAGTATRSPRVQLAMPISLNRWMTRRTESSSACTRRAITGTVLPPAEAGTTIARRSRTAEPVPLLVIRSSC
jgi:hypothetical protein